MSSYSNSAVRVNDRTRTRASRRLALSCLLFGLVGTGAGAAPISIPNFSFELPAQADGTFIASATNWVETGSGAHEAGAFNPTNASFTGATGSTLPGTAHGAQGAFLHAGGTAGVTLTTAASLGTIQANTTYTLTVALGSMTNFPATGQSISQAAFTILGNGSAIPGGQFTLDARTIPVGTFTDYTIAFSTGATGPLIGQSLTVNVGYAADLDSAIVADNVRLDASPVPEPTAAVLLAASSIVMLRRRRGAK